MIQLAINSYLNNVICLNMFPIIVNGWCNCGAFKYVHVHKHMGYNDMQVYGHK